ncbi:amino acid permease [Nevskia sp.]|uniref:APC family permease n=1 Tax=Nevskia sp. TaxID=1929292 RepID=UPI0025F2AC83|nr:amino acid permease [Nevskia sp.]
MSLFRTKAIETDLEKNTGLKRSLNAFDLVMLGIGAIIGTGIFVLTGKAAAVNAGPAVVLSFVVAGLACTFAALSYAELASSIGGAGSAYGYGYAGLGEWPAWIIGWMLVLEYAVAVPAVSAGWSEYLNTGLQSINLHLPAALTHSFLDPQHPGSLVNLPAVLIIATLGFVLAKGAKVGAVLNAIIVAVKLATIFLFIGVAVFHVDPTLWHPFIPAEVVDADGAKHFGWGGVFDGASKIFFAYLGFDAVSTAAEETKKPSRDLPIGILGSLGACTILYIVVSGLLTGIVPYTDLNVGSPVAYSLLQIGQKTAAGLISIGAIAGLTTVMLVMFYGLTRVLFAISRDGLLPSFFATLHPETKTPVGSIIAAGLIMLILGGFVPLGELADTANIGTLGAFVIACIGVLVLRRTRPDLKRPFKVPFGPLLPTLGVLSCGYLMTRLGQTTWTAFAIWLVIGQAIYFGYSRSHSKLAKL